jgi:hypothetical protein
MVNKCIRFLFTQGIANIIVQMKTATWIIKTTYSFSYF